MRSLLLSPTVDTLSDTERKASKKKKCGVLQCSRIRSYKERGGHYREFVKIGREKTRPNRDDVFDFFH